MRNWKWRMGVLVASATLTAIGCVTQATAPGEKESGDAARPRVTRLTDLEDIVGLAGGSDSLNGTLNNNQNSNLNDNSDNTNDNTGDNTNDNAGNTNDNTGNTNDNTGGNTNDNTGDNTNDNGDNTNGNDNGSGGTCPDGSHRVETELSGNGGDGDMRYRESANGFCKEFRARADEGLPRGTHPVTVNGIVVAHMYVDSDGRGEIRFETEDGNFPADFPRINAGDVGSIGGVLNGVFQLDCSSTGDNCNVNGNTNDNTGNDNAGNDNAGNTNDNTGNTNDNG